MANKIVSMTDLMNFVINKIISTCYNVQENYRLPSGYRNLSTFVLNQQGGIRFQVTVYDQALETVTKSEIENRLKSYFSQRGITTKVGAVATTKSMLNFLNNAAEFYACMVKDVVFSDGKMYPVFNKYGVTSWNYNKPTAKGTESSLKDQLNDPVKSNNTSDIILPWLVSMNAVDNAKQVGSSSSSLFICSCSSSSCSCSSSSCSSSSSSYIVYMIV